MSLLQNHDIKSWHDTTSAATCSSDNPVSSWTPISAPFFNQEVHYLRFPPVNQTERQEDSTSTALNMGAWPSLLGKLTLLPGFNKSFNYQFKSFDSRQMQRTVSSLCIQYVHLNFWSRKYLWVSNYNINKIETHKWNFTVIYCVKMSCISRNWMMKELWLISEFRHFLITQRINLMSQSSSNVFGNFELGIREAWDLYLREPKGYIPNLYRSHRSADS